MRSHAIDSTFFFQAEDGIRDLTVTGVQTCALPISARTGSPNGSRPTLPTVQSPNEKRSSGRGSNSSIERRLLGTRDRSAATRSVRRQTPPPTIRSESLEEVSGTVRFGERLLWLRTADYHPARGRRPDRAPRIRAGVPREHAR